MSDDLTFFALFVGVVVGVLLGVLITNIYVSRYEISNGCVVYKNTLYCEKESE